MVVSTVVGSVVVVVRCLVVVVPGRLVDRGWSRHLILVLQDSICSASPNWQIPFSQARLLVVIP